jgi:hypothetical protein
MGERLHFSILDENFITCSSLFYGQAFAPAGAGPLLRRQVSPYHKPRLTAREMKNEK